MNMVQVDECICIRVFLTIVNIYNNTDMFTTL